MKNRSHLVKNTANRFVSQSALIKPAAIMDPAPTARAIDFTSFASRLLRQIQERSATNAETHLFLDDYRTPQKACVFGLSKPLIEVSRVPAGLWTTVVNFDQFVDHLKRHGMPKTISFDHDLHDEHIQDFLLNTQYSGHINYGSYTHRTGLDCAKLVMELLRLDPTLKRPTVYVHSANPAGRKNIIQVLKPLIAQ